MDQLPSPTIPLSGAPVDDVTPLLSRLRLLSHECAAAQNLDEVVAATVAQSAAGAGAAGAVLYLLRGTMLEQIGSCGLDEAGEERWRGFPLGADLPLAVAARTREPVWLTTLAERRARFPVLASWSQGFIATASLPLLARGREIGALGVAYRDEHVFTAAEKLFLLTLADLVATALLRLGGYASTAGALAFQHDPLRTRTVDGLWPDAGVETTDFDRLASLAARFCGAPTGQVSLLSSSQTVAGRHPRDPAASLDRSPLEDSLCTVTVRTAAPLLVTDTRSDERVESLPPVTGGGVRSYLGVPLRSHGVVIGALCVYDSRPREWDATHVGVLEDLSLAVVRELESRATAARAMALERWSHDLRGFTEALAGLSDPDMVLTALATRVRGLRPMRYVAAVTWDRAGAVRASAAWSPAMLPERPWPFESGGAGRLAKHLGETDELHLVGVAAILERFPEGLGPVLDLAARSMLAVPISRVGEVVGGLVACPDEADSLDADLVRQLGDLGSATGSALERIAWYRAQVEERARVAFLADLSLELESSLDVDEIVQRMARMAVPAIADGCLVHLSDGRSTRLVAVAHLDAGKERNIRAHAARCAAVAGQIQRAMTAWDVITVEPGCPCGNPADADVPAWRYAAGVTAVLQARGRVLGTIWFAQDRDDDRSGMLDPVFVRDLARHAGLALDNALLYRQRQDAVLSLQRRLLPPSLPKVAGFDLAACYETADVSLDVGGDFYDAIWQPAGTLSLIIGDVCGRGADAAGMTGLARHTLRAVLADGATPAQALGRLNRAVLADGNEQLFCTTLVAAVEGDGSGASVTIASGGHPLPYLVRHDGRVEQVGISGHLLGVVDRVSHPEIRCDLGPGDALFLYTDGVTEARRENEMFEDHLPSELELCGGLTAGALVERIRRAVVAYRGSGADDVAILALRLRGRRLLGMRLDAVPESAGAARRAVGRMCAEHALNLAEGGQSDLVLAVSELVATAAVRSRGPLDLFVDQVGDTVRAEVHSPAPGVADREILSVDRYADAARGALIVSWVSDRAGIWHDDNAVAWVEVKLVRG